MHERRSVRFVVSRFIGAVGAICPGESGQFVQIARTMSSVLDQVEANALAAAPLAARAQLADDDRAILFRALRVLSDAFSIVHEFLHTQNYFHAGQHCASGKSSDVSIRWDPDDQGFIQGIGLDRTPGSGGAPGTYRRLVPNARPLPLLSGQTAEYYDLMSYCNASGDESNLWIDPRTWDSFQSSPFPLGLPTLALSRVGRARAAAAGRTLRVSAAVNPDGSGEITSVGPGGSASSERQVRR